jgi:tetratricopeptide (TPR) repeat protein
MPVRSGAVFPFGRSHAKRVFVARWIAVAALALSAPLPLAAQTPFASVGKAIPAEQLKRALASAQQAIAGQDCHAALAALDPLVPQLGDDPTRAIVQRLRLMCLGVDGRAADIPAVQRELTKSMPRDGLVQAFGVLVAADESRFVDAANQIATLASSSPQSLEILTGASVRAISVRLTEQHAYQARADMLVALAQVDWQPADFPELRLNFAQGAIEALLGNGKVDDAAALLDRIDQPEMLTSMAIERHYTPLWPAIERKLGPQSGLTIDRFARDRLGFFANNPNSEAALRDATNAMLLLGRYTDVVDMTDRVTVHAGISRDAVRTLLYRARAFAALKRDDDAVNLFNGFMALDLREIPEATPAYVNYAEFLDEIGREEEALATARIALDKASGMLTDFGKRWLDRTEVCALSALGRADEANAAADRLKALSGQNPAAAIEALLCAKRDTEASAIALKAFDDGDVASNLVVQFQPAGSTWAPAPSRLRALWLAFLSRPEIKVAFEHKGRILPQGLWPAADPRAIPRRASGSSLT